MVCAVVDHKIELLQANYRLALCVIKCFTGVQTSWEFAGGSKFASFVCSSSPTKCSPVSTLYYVLFLMNKNATKISKLLSKHLLHQCSTFVQIYLF